MENDPRIIELLSDILIEQRQSNVRLERLEQQQMITNSRLLKLEKGVSKLEEQQAKTNIAIGELLLSVMKLAEKFETVAQHDKRITRLEEVVFHA